MNLANLKELLATITFQFTKNLVHPQTKKDVKLILFLNQPWGNSLNFEGLELPPNFELTTNKSRYREAAAVVFHIPTFLLLIRSTRRMSPFTVPYIIWPGLDGCRQKVVALSSTDETKEVCFA